MLKFAALTVIFFATAACAHAAQNLCENPSHTAKRAVLIVKGSDPSAPTLVFPSDGADYSNNPAVVWDISNGKTTQFQAVCYPNETGFANAWTADVPLGSNGCQFLNGVFTCN